MSLPTSPRVWRSSAWRLLVVAALAFVALLAMPARLLGHAHLERSTPAAGAKLAAAPTALILWFSEKPELAFTQIVLRGADSSEIALGTLQPVEGSPTGVTATIASPLAPGRYTVAWQTAGADGHPSRGRFSFTVLPSAQPVPGAAPPAATPADSQHVRMMERHTEGEPHAMDGGADAELGAETPAYVAVRWVSFVALLGLVGVVAFRWIVWPAASRRAESNARGDALRAIERQAIRRVAWLGLVAGAVLLVAAITRLYVQSYTMHGAAQALSGSMLGTMITATTWGAAWLAQVVAALVTVVALAAAARSSGARGPGAAWPLATLAVVVLAFTPALGGHAEAAPRLSALAVAADGLHVLGAGGWLGALLVVATVGVPVAMAADEPARGGLVADLVNAFSPAALGCAALVVLTGLLGAWIHLGSVGVLWSSTYGRVLLLKLAVLVPVLATGAWNWRRVRPTLGDVAAAARLQRSARVELVTAALVVLVTAVLVALQTPV